MKRFLWILPLLFLAACDKTKPPKEPEYLIPFESAAEVADHVSSFALLAAGVGFIILLRGRRQRTTP